jgi:hypothetical protein
VDYEKLGYALGTVRDQPARPSGSYSRDHRAAGRGVDASGGSQSHRCGQRGTRIETLSDCRPRREVHGAVEGFGEGERDGNNSSATDVAQFERPR